MMHETVSLRKIVFFYLILDDPPVPKRVCYVTKPNKIVKAL